MTVKQYLETEKPKKYIITDRMRTPFSDEQLKWLDLAEIDIRNVDKVDAETIRIQTDYMPDAC
ncbi:hypothetical protein JV173_01615 [Acholeplasma equirhinis]|uniref:hypothetical protein n=1 Tax=Acholeplasma equirhinis TaxID=555393 RepID=UPI00197AA67F|nr:hypothetical protein [Acholeplasma equirhinis]MBN3490202.1 hypothetical protein [Acholeplasma equirhinis]